MILGVPPTIIFDQCALCSVQQKSDRFTSISRNRPYFRKKSYQIKDINFASCQASSTQCADGESDKIVLDKKKLLQHEYLTSLWTSKLIYCSFYQHHSPKDPMGVYSSGFLCRIRFSRFGVRPCCSRAARSQKPLKKSHVLSKIANFRRFLASSCSRTAWSHPKPKKSNST